MPGHEELRHGRQGTEERTDADHDQDDLEDLPDGRLRVESVPSVATVSSVQRKPARR